MRRREGTRLLFAEFLSVHRCHVGHVLTAALGKINGRARAAKTREVDGAFVGPSGISPPETHATPVFFKTTFKTI